jgi:hypothetical protein
MLVDHITIKILQVFLDPSLTAVEKVMIQDRLGKLGEAAELVDLVPAVQAAVLAVLALIIH